MADRVKLAEDVNDWFKKAWFERNTSFSDLLEVENHLADLSGVTVLFVESPGSIAELGAFAASDDLKHKTLAILNEFHNPDGSFIGDGPIRRILKKNKKHVLYYDWNPDKLNSAEALQTLDEIACDLTLFLEERAATQLRRVAFKRQRVGHVLMLVADLVWFLGAAKRSDIADCLQVLKFNRPNVMLNRHLAGC